MIRYSGQGSLTGPQYKENILLLILGSDLQFKTTSHFKEYSIRLRPRAAKVHVRKKNENNNNNNNKCSGI